MPFEALFVPDELREALSDRAWLDAMLEAERALAVAVARAGLTSELPRDVFAADGLVPEDLAREGRPAGNPVEPLVRGLRARAPDVHHGATSQDVMDTAQALVARDALEIVLRELDAVAAECARLADEHRATLMPARTLLQQAVPTTFGLKAAGGLVSIVDVRAVLADAELPAQLGGAAGTLAAFGDRGEEVLRHYCSELRLREPVVPWHALRVPVAILGARLGIAATTVAKIATDLVLLSQTEVAEVRELEGGRSSTMPHKHNPIASTLARACAAGAHAAAGVLAGAVHEHERAAGAWHGEWKALSDALALTGGAAAAVHRALNGLEVDVARMRANLSDETLSEAARFREGRVTFESYLGAADAFVARALEHYHR